MIATASHSFEVNNLSIPANRIFVIDAAHAVLKQPIYQYPFLQFAEATLAVNSAGMAARFIQLAAEIFNRRAVHKSFTAVALQAALQTASNAILQLNVTRQRFYAAVQSSWRYCIYNGIIEATLLNEVSAASRVLAATSLRTVDELYPFCGMAAADNGTEINRVWRNLHTASQHSLLLPA